MTDWVWFCENLINYSFVYFYVFIPLGVKCLMWNVSSTKRRMSSMPEASVGLLDFILLLHSVSEVQALCLSSTPGWFFIGNTQTDNPVITEMVCYHRPDVWMKVDRLCLCVQTSLSALPKLVPHPFQKVIKLTSHHFETVVLVLSPGVQETAGLSPVSKGVTICCSHLGGHPGKAFGSTSEAE